MKLEDLPVDVQGCIWRYLDKCDERNLGMVSRSINIQIFALQLDHYPLDVAMRNAVLQRWKKLGTPWAQHKARLYRQKGKTLVISSTDSPVCLKPPCAIEKLILDSHPSLFMYDYMSFFVDTIHTLVYAQGASCLRCLNTSKWGAYFQARLPSLRRVELLGSVFLFCRCECPHYPLTYLRIETLHNPLSSHADLPSTLQHLEIERMYDEVQPGAIPANVEYLRMHLSFSQRIVPGLFPENLKHLVLVGNPKAYGYRMMTGNTFPRSLISLSFSSGFQNQYLSGSLPSTLKTIRAPSTSNLSPRIIASCPGVRILRDISL